MKKLIFAAFIGIATLSCEKKISTFSENESHNHGQNCMNCHKAGGESGNEGRFKIAGSVFDSTKTVPYAGAVVNLYSGPSGSGELVRKLEVDQIGNFYTTKKVKLKKGIYPAVVGANGVETFMSFSVTTGSCNSCHGVSTDRLWVAE